MCGIVAVLSLERPVDAPALERAIRSLTHRGPDGRAALVLPTGPARGVAQVALGHTRLALVDPAGGAQPISNEDESVAVVVSGELYDDEQLRADLEARGHRFRTRSDSELCVHLYEEHGDAFVERLRGEFAFALWDRRRERLVCGRDRFGVRPLCWARLPGGGVAVASEAKALFALGVEPRWDEAALFFAASVQYVPVGSTLFSGIAQLPPGHMLVADARGVAARAYWDLDLPAPRDKREVSGGELLAALDEAVRVRTRGDAPVACQLSGGIDSSLVAALAARAQPSRPLDCFTLSFGGSAEYDEIEIARRTAAHLGASIHPVPADAAALWDALPAAIAQGEGLVVNLHAPAKLLLSRVIRAAGYRVVLTGEGADEVLGGYPHFRRDLLEERGASGDELASVNRASAGIMWPEGAGLPTAAVREVLGFVPSWIEAKAALGARVTALLAPSFLERFAGRDVYRELASAFDPVALRGRERIDVSSYTWCKLALAGYILRTLGDGMEMAHSVEGRLPFLDHHLFELARTIPTHQKIHGEQMVEKFILREAARDVLPREILTRRKHPLLAPPILAKASPVEDWLRGAALPPFFERAAIVRVLDELRGAPEHERRLWDPAMMTVASAVLLHDRYRMGSS